MVLSCPNKQRSFEPCVCLDLIPRIIVRDFVQISEMDIERYRTVRSHLLIIHDKLIRCTSLSVLK